MLFSILMMSGKLSAPGLLKIKLFQNEGCDVIISASDVTKKKLLRALNSIVDVVM